MSQLYLGDEHQNTKVIMKTSDPQYEEFFTFGLEDSASAQLKVKCFHYDSVIPDHYICMSQLSLHDLPICEAPDGLQTYCDTLGATEVVMSKNGLEATSPRSSRMTMRLTMYLTKHTKPPKNIFAQVQSCTLKGKSMRVASEKLLRIQNHF